MDRKLQGQGEGESQGTGYGQQTAIKTNNQDQQAREENTNIKHGRTPQTNHEDGQRSLYEKTVPHIQP